MPVQRCPQCGTPRRGDMQVCVSCERRFPDSDDVELALPRPAAPSPTQSHGTLMAGLLAGFVVLALLLWLSVRGVGPFEARVVDTAPRNGEVAVTVEVRNTGDKAGSGRCAITRTGPGEGDVQQPFQFMSQRVEGGATIRQVVVVPVDPGVTTGEVSC